MKPVPRILKITLAAVLAGALGAWLLAPEGARVAPSLASWTAWKQARELGLDDARSTLDAVSGALAIISGTGARWDFPATSSGTKKSDADRLNWDRATAHMLSGAWTDAAFGFALASDTGSTIPRQTAFSKLGDVLYRIGESGDADPVTAWKLAVAAYGKSLVAAYDDDVWNNREFVLKKLREEERKNASKNGQPQKNGQQGQGGSNASPEDKRSLEQQIRDAARSDQELRRWLRPDGQKPQMPRLPSELLQKIMGGDSGGGGQDEKKDW